MIKFIFFLVSILNLQLAFAERTQVAPWTRFLPDKLVNWGSANSTTELNPQNPLHQEILYGKELIVNTARYIGPDGSVGKFLGNKMNCQNCHLDAGTRHFGGSFATVHARYPQFRERNNNIITLADRINQCINRPHNGRDLPLNGREIKAIQIYMKWLGENKVIGQNAFGDQLPRLPEIGRPASSDNGKIIYQKNCQQCHGLNGQGLPTEDKKTFTYPPLWGPQSYTIGSSMHRIRIAAAFIKHNMPFGVKWNAPILSDEEAYDVASFINNEKENPRPAVDVSSDYPSLKNKPADYPYGPYSDPFSELEHKLGPWNRIEDYYKNKWIK